MCILPLIISRDCKDQEPGLFAWSRGEFIQEVTGSGCCLMALFRLVDFGEKYVQPYSLLPW